MKKLLVVLMALGMSLGVWGEASASAGGYLILSTPDGEMNLSGLPTTPSRGEHITIDGVWAWPNSDAVSGTYEIKRVEWHVGGTGAHVGTVLRARRL